MIRVIGAGLAGCEAAWQIAQAGLSVALYEMKPKKHTPAHHADTFAELVCSNSLKASRLDSAPGMLKAEMERAPCWCPVQRQPQWRQGALLRWSGMRFPEW